MEKQRYYEYLREKIGNKQVILYPMGILAKVQQQYFKKYGIHVSFYCDKNKELVGTEYQGVTCISIEQLLDMPKSDFIVLIASGHCVQIKKELCHLGIETIENIQFEREKYDDWILNHSREEFDDSVQKVLNVCCDEKSKEIFQTITSAWLNNELAVDYYEKICSPAQYFDKEIIKLHENEVFVDCGAYTGDSAAAFYQAVAGKFDAMHLLEVDSSIYLQLIENIQKYPTEIQDKVKCYPIGVSNQQGTLKLLQGNRDSTFVEEKEIANTVDVPVDALDTLLRDEKITFIKMDIEGAERDGLEGAKELICKNRPILAICIYHSPQDMLELPIILSNIAPNYHIYIRHYTNTMYETVCYAIPQE